MSTDDKRALVAIGGLVVAGLLVDYFARQGGATGSSSARAGSISNVSGQVTVAGTIYGGGFPPLSPIPGGCRCGS